MCLAARTTYSIAHSMPLARARTRTLAPLTPLAPLVKALVSAIEAYHTRTCDCARFKRFGVCECKLATIASNLKDEAAVADAFQEADVDGSGTLTVDELAGLAKTLGSEMEEGELREALRTLDADSSGDIDYDVEERSEEGVSRPRTREDFRTWYGAVPTLVRVPRYCK